MTADYRFKARFIEYARGWLEPIAASRATLVALWLGGFVVYARALTNNDVAWFLVGTAKWLSGARLYDGVVEVNPPLVFYLDLPSVVLAQLTGISATALFVVYVFALIALSLWLVTGLSAEAAEGGIERWALPLASLAAIAVFPSRDFGQREHLMLVFCLPYLILAACRARRDHVGNRLAALIGVLAGIGFALKPQFLLVPLLLEMYLALQRRSHWTLWRPELAALAVVVLAYAVSIPLVAPDYLTRVVPYALLVYGKGYGNSHAFVIATWQSLVLPCVLLAHFLSRWRQRNPQFADVFLIGAVVFYGIYLAEMKGWTYQVLPVNALLFLAVSAAVSTGGRPPFGALAMCGMLVVPLAEGTYVNPTTELLAPVVRKQIAGGALYVFSSYVWLGFPLADTVGARWTSRFPSLWLLPGVEQGLRSARAKSDKDLADAYTRIERYTVDAVVEDFTKDTPTVVVVDERPDPRFAGVDFEYLAFFEHDPRFARLWSQYVKLARVDGDGVGPYDIYVLRHGHDATASLSHSSPTPP